MGVVWGLEDILQGIVAYHRDAKEDSGVKEEPSGRCHSTSSRAVECKLLLSLIVA